MTRFAPSAITQIHNLALFTPIVEQCDLCNQSMTLTRTATGEQSQSLGFNSSPTVEVLTLQESYGMLTAL